MAYTTLSEVRALDGLDDETLFPDSALNDAIAFAEELILDYCGPWAPTSITLTFQGSGTDVVTLGISGVRSLDTLTVNGTSAISGASVTWEGVLTLADVAYADDLIVATVTAGYQATAPERLSWAARTIARQYVLDLARRTPDRALSVASEFGNITLAQAGGNGRPTNLPDVNAVLQRFHSPAVG